MYSTNEVIEIDNEFNNTENWLSCEFKDLRKGDRFRVRNANQQLDEYAEIFECMSDCIFDSYMGWHCEIL